MVNFLPFYSELALSLIHPLMVGKNSPTALRQGLCRALEQSASLHDGDKARLYCFTLNGIT